MQQPFTPELFADTHVLLDWIATGGMAEIYAAANKKALSQDRIYAIKKLLPRYSSNQQLVTMLIAEAKICTLLKHPNIVHVFDLGVAGSDFYIAMEFVHGKSLAQLLLHLKQKRERIPMAIALDILEQFGRGLDYAHKASDASNRPLNLVHRDVTPGNVLLSYSGTVYLTDFGIATVAQHKMQDQTPPLGKLAYMAPEQLRNQSIDYRADIYAAALLFYEMITGTTPYTAENAVELQQKILTEEPRPVRQHLRDFSKQADALIMAALAKEIGHRPVNIKAFITNLKATISTTSSENCHNFLMSLFKKEKEEEEQRLQKALTLAPKLVQAAEQSPSAVLASTQDATNIESTVLIPQDNEEMATAFMPQPIADSTTAAHDDEVTDVKQKAATVPTASQAATANELVDELMQLSQPEFGLDPNSGETEVGHVEEDDTLYGGKTPPPIKHDRLKGKVIGKVNLASQEAAREQFLEGLKEESADQEIDKETVKKPKQPVEEDSVSSVKNEPVQPLTPPPATSVSSEGVPITEISSATRTIKKHYGVAAALLLLVVAAAYFVSQRPTPMGSSGASSLKSLTKPKVKLQLFAEKPSTPREEKILGRFLAPSNLGEAPSIHSIPRFFHREFARITGRKDYNMQLLLEGPLFVSRAAPIQPRLLQPSQTYKYFEQQLNENGAKPYHPVDAAHSIEGEDVRVHIYFYQKELGKKSNYPLEYFGYRRDREGILFIPLVKDNFEFSLVNLVHEIIHLMGGKDKFNDYGKALYPYGFFDPTKTPIFPQSHAEVMARTIPIDAEKTKPVTRLSQIRIGIQTAFELGWLDADQRDSYYAQVE